MNAHVIALILVRILSLYVFIQGISQLAGVLQLAYPYLFADFELVPLVFYSAVPGVIMLSIGVALWFGAEKLACRMLGGKVDGKETNPATEIGYRDHTLYKLGLSLIGFVLLVENVPSLLGDIVQLIQNANNPFPEFYERERRQAWRGLLVSGIKIAIALLLIVKSGIVYGWIRKWVDAGSTKNNNTPT